MRGVREPRRAGVRYWGGVYSSLDKIDVVTGGPTTFVQTDHRSRDEMEATPEITTLFALTRVLNPQQHAERQGLDGPVVYVTSHADLPDCLREALAVTGAQHRVGATGEGRTYPAGDATADDVADDAFRALAARVSRRVGLTDMATVLRALEAETLADPPSQEDDEAGYWTRVFELAAVTCEIVRARSGGQWEIHHHADVPFGFATARGGSGRAVTPASAPGAGGIILATNRAHRFIADGQEESMFLLLAADREVSAAAMHTEDLPVMPNLRARREAIACELGWRPLFAGAPDDDGFPVIVYGHDTPETFGAFLASRAGDLAAIHDQALHNLAAQEPVVQDVEMQGVNVVAVSGSYYAAEKLLDRAFMRTLHRRLGHDILAVSVPRRGLMFVTAVERSDKRELLVLHAATRHEARTTRSISEAIVLVKDGEVVGHVEISAREGDDRDGDAGGGDDDARRDDDFIAGGGDDGGADVGRGDDDADAADGAGGRDDARGRAARAQEPPTKKPGWLARLFGRKK